MSPDRRYYVYIMASSSGVLYTGSTSDLIRRVYQHKTGLLSRFTANYAVNKLVYFEDTRNSRAAVEREREIKRWRREKKVALIEACNPAWLDLGLELLPPHSPPPPHPFSFPAVKPIPLIIVGLLFSVACASAQQQRQQAAAIKASPSVPTEALAGQQVAVMPLTLVAADSALQADTLYAPYRDRRTTLTWADSLIGEAFTGRAPEVRWMLPPELRKIARRSPGIVGDPDAMGQAALRSPKLKDIPDPLRSSLRNLSAVAGGRVAMVPAALSFSREDDGRIRADLSLVAADTRGGKVIWRATPAGQGATPSQALEAALAAVLPVDLTGP